MAARGTTAARAEIAEAYAKAYQAATKKDKSRLLDEIVEATGWSRDNARRRLREAMLPRPATPRKRRRSRKYSNEALKSLQRVWTSTGGSCGKALAASMDSQLASLEGKGRLAFGKGGYSPEVRAELLAMSPATIDRYLAPTRAKAASRAKTTTKLSSSHGEPRGHPGIRGIGDRELRAS